MNDIKILDVIYDGEHSKVYKICCNQQIYALKSIPIDHYGIPDIALREITLLNKLKNKHIIHCHSVLISHTHISLLLNYCDYNLRKYIKKDFKNTFNMILKFKEICLGVQYLHSHHIMHRDLKPDNILLCDDQIIICDFGLATYTTNQVDYSSNVVTLWYRAPEVLLKLDYSLPIDIWSLGCILFEMLTQQILYQGDDYKDMLKLIYHINLNELKLENHMMQLLNKLLIINDYERIIINDVLKYLSYHYSL